MSTDTRWTWLVAVPVLCCVGHAVLVALGVGSLAAVGGTTGRVTLAAVAVAVGVVAIAAAVAVMVVRHRGRA